MKLIACAVLVEVVAAVAAGQVKQVGQADNKVEQQILEELRAMHRDMRVSTSLQVLLVELQMTQGSVDRAMQRRDALLAQDAQLQLAKRSAQGERDRFQDRMDKVARPDQDLVDRLEQLKEEYRKAAAQETAVAQQLQEAEGRLRIAERERDEVQQQVGNAVKRLSPAP